MFAKLVDTVRADIRRQSAWVRSEVERQTRYSALTAAFAGIGAVAAIGVATVALIAIYSWVAIYEGPFIALAVVGAILLVVACIAFAVASNRERPALRSPPPLESLSPKTVLHSLKPAFLDFDGSPETAEKVMNAASESVRHGSREAMYGTLAMAIVIGLIAGRRL